MAFLLFGFILVIRESPCAVGRWGPEHEQALQAACRDRGLRVSGAKAELLLRLTEDSSGE